MTPDDLAAGVRQVVNEWMRQLLAIGWGPIFNAADVCVVVGVAILTWRLLADGRDPASA